MTNSLPTQASPTSAGALLRLIREEVAVTRADLARASGLARSTVAQRVDALLEQGLVYEAGGSHSTGGRPATLLAFNREAGVVLVADLGATHARVAVSDLVGTPLAERASDLDIALGPETALAWVAERFSELLDEVGRSGSDVRGIGVGVPGPVEFDSGRPVNPPIMPGWDDFPIPEWFADLYRDRRRHRGGTRAAPGSPMPSTARSNPPPEGADLAEPDPQVEAGASGSSTKNVEPIPSPDSTQIFPPIRRTISRQM